MSDDDDITGSTAMAAQHALFPRRSLRVAPTDGSTRFNAIRIPLIPVACWRLNHPGFAFDSSFVAPTFRDEIATLSGVVSANPDCPAALFGHCDPVGGDDVNKTLGDRRVTAVYALLTRQPDLWMRLYDHPKVGDRWGAHAIQCMLQSLADGNGDSYYAGDVQGRYDAATVAAVRRFQSDNGLSPDGQAGAHTLRKLFAAYMDWLCTPDGSTAPFVMRPSAFLGGAGAQTGDLPKMSLQGCSRFNPIVVLPRSEMGSYDTTRRDADDAPNRRVIMFLFPRGTQVDPAQWPCPKVDDSYHACKSAFWSDGDRRRQSGATLRLYKDTRDTMACRFYDRFARRSPCERPIAKTTVIAARPSSLCSVGRTFPKPSLLPTLKEIAKRMKADPTLRVLVMGNTDATGDDPQKDHDLSLARANAVKALLTKDADFFRQRFDGADRPESWDWQEVQWMLSAITDGQGNPLYAGRVDGHRGTVSMLGAQIVKLAAATEGPVHRQVDDATLKAVIAAYLDLAGDAVPAGRVDVVGGGSWHPPRSFGPGGGPVGGPDYESTDMPFYRRFELFLSQGPLSPSAAACPASKHDDCAAYATWCDRAQEVIDRPPDHDALVTVLDADGVPIAGATVTATNIDDGEVAGTFTTSDAGVATITLPAPKGWYVLETSYDDCPPVALDLRVPDQQGGAVLRVDHSVRWTFDDPDDETADGSADGPANGDAG